jgi:GNAT superfamily N-acetyltransferase
VSYTYVERVPTPQEHRILAQAVGAFSFSLQDVAVDRAHRGRGVGSELVTRLLRQVERVAPPDAFVGLFAADSSGALYERYGFAVHPGMTGMYRGAGSAR